MTVHVWHVFTWKNRKLQVLHSFSNKDMVISKLWNQDIFLSPRHFFKNTRCNSFQQIFMVKICIYKNKIQFSCNAKMILKQHTHIFFKYKVHSYWIKNIFVEVIHSLQKWIEYENILVIIQRISVTILFQDKEISSA